jgi:hypothetical protein
MKENNFEMSELKENTKEILLNKIYDNITKPNKLNFLITTFQI